MSMPLYAVKTAMKTAESAAAKAHTVPLPIGQNSAVSRLPVQQRAAPLTKEMLAHTFKKLDLEIPIRVELDEKSNLSDVAWKCGSQGGFLVFAPETKRKMVYQMVNLQITATPHSFVINGKMHPEDHLFLIPLKGPFLCQKRIYDGVLAITRYKGTAYLVNHVDLEDYVLSVLPYESWAAWPDEVHRVFSIVFRSYGIAKVLEQRALHAKRGLAVPYDIKNTNEHQIYKGRSNSERFRRIIDQTRGVVLAYKNKNKQDQLEPILAMFDICCGGVVPARKKGIHFSKAPYLARAYPCNFCKKYGSYRWTRSFEFDELQKALLKDMPSLGAIRDIKVGTRDDAGVVLEVMVRGAHRWACMSAGKFKTYAKELPSLCFALEKAGNKVSITGKGHGHHMGLCQRGAYYMVLQKWNYKNILRFFYPQTQFMKLTKISY